MQFLVLDLTLVAGIDMSSAEAFVRIHRLLSSRFVTLVFCGFEADSSIGKSLGSVDVLGAPGVVLFATFNDAIECECYFSFNRNWQVMRDNRFFFQGQRMLICVLGLSRRRLKLPPSSVSTFSTIEHPVAKTIFFSKLLYQVDRMSTLNTTTYL